MKALQRISFSYSRPRGDLRHFVTEEDVRVVLSRLPAVLWTRLDRVYFKSSRRRNSLGYVTPGRRDINLCALPPRISLTGALRKTQSPRRFGALRGSQWPHLAVRRFMLYDVFLHELGHLQEIDRSAKNWCHRFAKETASQDFGEKWCRRLWAQPYDHPDPVHNPPSAQEIEILEAHWPDAHDAYKRALQHELEGNTDAAFVDYHRAVERYPEHSLALEALGVLSFETINSAPDALGFLQRALRIDPALYEANVFIALALARLGKEQQAREHFERALRVSFGNSATMALYARVLGDFGHHDEAKLMFAKVLQKAPRGCPFVEHNYKMFLRTLKINHGQDLGLRTVTFEEDDWKVVRECFGRTSRTLVVTSYFSEDAVPPPRMVS